MSATLFCFVAIGLLAVTWSLCFVGCFLDSSGVPGTSTDPEPYSNIVLGEPSLIAYWPLNDAQSGSGTLITSGSLLNSSSFGEAADLTADFANPDPHPGTYIAPPAYPNPPIASSATIAGTPTIGPAGSIVPGDVGNSTFQDKLTDPASADLEGGYVSIPWNTPKAPQLGEFTFEAWIQPNWSGTGTAHVLFGALATNSTGFVIAVDENNQLQLVVGNGTTTAAFSSSKVVISPSPGLVTYLGVSFDSTTQMFNLFATAFDRPAMTDTIGNTGYVATDPTDPTLEMTFFIGAGRNAQAPRTTAGDINGAPEFPFQGQMQSVALYGSASIDFQSHFNSGSAAS